MSTKQSFRKSTHMSESSQTEVLMNFVVSVERDTLTKMKPAWLAKYKTDLFVMNDSCVILPPSHEIDMEFDNQEHIDVTMVDVSDPVQGKGKKRKHPENTFFN